MLGSRRPFLFCQNTEDSLAHCGGGLHKNKKTLYSVDFTTICPRVRQGTPCRYCYVHRRRVNTGKGKKEIEYVPYNGFVRDFRPSIIAKLNAFGGLRMFAYADYMPEHDADISRFLADCKNAGLQAKALTKHVGFIEKFGSHTALSVINVSVDNLEDPYGSPVSLEEAWDLRQRFGNVLIRAVIVDEEDLVVFGDKSRADILTLNHALWPSTPKKRCHMFSNVEKQEIATRFPGRVCASGPSGKCSDCPVKCGTAGLLEAKNEGASERENHAAA